MRTMMMIAVAGLALVGCAPTSTSNTDGIRAEQACFSPDRVQNFRAGDVGRLHVRAAGGDVFEIQAAGGCTNLDFAQRLAILPDGAALAGGRVCTFDSVRLAAPGTTSSTDVCRARVTRRLSVEEVAALPNHQRP